MVGLELLLLDPALRSEPERLLALLHADFFEHGASGHVWTRRTVAAATVGTSAPIVATDVAARRLGADAALVTYRSDTDGRRALRSSTWVREGDCWQLLFHQGTLVDAT